MLKHSKSNEARTIFILKSNQIKKHNYRQVNIIETRTYLASLQLSGKFYEKGALGDE